MLLLGIETSCDETAAAVVQDGRKLLSNVVASSVDLHKAYGGVVPEIAARSHIESITPVIESALRQAFESSESRVASREKTAAARNSKPEAIASIEDLWSEIDAIAVTYGAGLGGSLLIGVMTARTLAIAKNKPLYAINHVEGHTYANFLTESSPALSDYKLPSRPPKFPMLGLIVSGGHSQLVLWQDHFNYKLLGQTYDDAVGEAFDKVAKMIGLPYPGGPSIAKLALKGNPNTVRLPKAKVTGKYSFSFSGLKTAVLRAAQELIGEDYRFPSHQLSARLSEAHKANIAASFQRVAIQTLVDKTIEAFNEFKPESVVIGGGVAASQELRQQLKERLPINIEYPDIRLMTDNGAMIAALGCYKAATGQPKADPFSLEIAPDLSM